MRVSWMLCELLRRFRRFDPSWHPIGARPSRHLVVALSIGLDLMLESEVHPKMRKYAVVVLTGSLVEPVLKPSPLLLVCNACPVFPVLANECLVGHVSEAEGLDSPVICTIEGHGWRRA